MNCWTSKPNVSYSGKHCVMVCLAIILVASSKIYCIAPLNSDCDYHFLIIILLIIITKH